MDLQAIEPITFRTADFTDRAIRQKQDFFKAVLLGTLPFGPYLVLVKDWKTEENVLAMYLSAASAKRVDVHMVVSRRMAWPRKRIVPVPAKTTQADVERACEKAQKTLHIEKQVHELDAEQFKAITSHVILQLTGHLPPSEPPKQSPLKSLN